MSEINGQTDDVALLVNWFFCSPFPPYENLKVDKALGVEANRSGGRGEDTVMNFIQLQVVLFLMFGCNVKFQHYT